MNLLVGVKGIVPERMFDRDNLYLGTGEFVASG